MTQIDQDTRLTYTYDSAVTRYDFEFYTRDKIYVQVDRYDTSNYFKRTALVQDVDYSVTMNTGNVGGYITLLKPFPNQVEGIEDMINIYLDEPYENATRVPIYYGAERIEKQEDNTVRLTQQNRDRIDELWTAAEETLGGGDSGVPNEEGRVTEIAEAGTNKLRGTKMYRNTTTNEMHSETKMHLPSLRLNNVNLTAEGTQDRIFALDSPPQDSVVNVQGNKLTFTPYGIESPLQTAGDQQERVYVPAAGKVATKKVKFLPLDANNLQIPQFDEATEQWIATSTLPIPVAEDVHKSVVVSGAGAFELKKLLPETATDTQIAQWVGADTAWKATIKIPHPVAADANKALVVASVVNGVMQTKWDVPETLIKPDVAAVLDGFQLVAGTGRNVIVKKGTLAAYTESTDIWEYFKMDNDYTYTLPAGNTHYIYVTTQMTFGVSQILITSRTTRLSIVEESIYAFLGTAHVNILDNTLGLIENYPINANQVLLQLYQFIEYVGCTSTCVVDFIPNQTTFKFDLKGGGYFGRGAKNIPANNKDGKGATLVLSVPAESPKIFKFCANPLAAGYNFVTASALPEPLQWYDPAGASPRNFTATGWGGWAVTLVPDDNGVFQMYVYAPIEEIIPESGASTPTNSQINAYYKKIVDTITSKMVSDAILGLMMIKGSATDTNNKLNYFFAKTTDQLTTGIAGELVGTPNKFITIQDDGVGTDVSQFGENEIISLQSRMTTAEGDINTLEAQRIIADGNIVQGEILIGSGQVGQWVNLSAKSSGVAFDATKYGNMVTTTETLTDGNLTIGKGAKTIGDSGIPSNTVAIVEGALITGNVVIAGSTSRSIKDGGAPPGVGTGGGGNGNATENFYMVAGSSNTPKNGFLIKTDVETVSQAPIKMQSYGVEFFDPIFPAGKTAFNAVMRNTERTVLLDPVLSRLSVGASSYAGFRRVDENTVVLEIAETEIIQIKIEPPLYPPSAIAVWKGHPSDYQEVSILGTNTYQNEALKQCKHTRKQLGKVATWRQTVTPLNGIVGIDVDNYRSYTILSSEDIIGWMAFSLPDTEQRTLTFVFAGDSAISWPSNWKSVFPLPTKGRASTSFRIMITSCTSEDGNTNTMFVTAADFRKADLQTLPLAIYPPYPTDGKSYLATYSTVFGRQIRANLWSQQTGDTARRKHTHKQVGKTTAYRESVRISASGVRLNYYDYSSHDIEVNEDLLYWYTSGYPVDSTHSISFFITAQTARIAFPPEVYCNFKLAATYPRNTLIRINLMIESASVWVVSLKSIDLNQPTRTVTLIPPFPNAGTSCLATYASGTGFLISCVPTCLQSGSAKMNMIHQNVQKGKIVHQVTNLTIVGGVLTIDLLWGGTTKFSFTHTEDVTSFVINPDVKFQGKDYAIMIIRKIGTSSVFPRMVGYIASNDGTIPFGNDRETRFVLQFHSNGTKELHYIYNRNI